MRQSYDIRRDLIFVAYPEIRMVEIGAPVPLDAPQDDVEVESVDDPDDESVDEVAVAPHDDPFDDEDYDYYAGRAAAARSRRAAALRDSVDLNGL